MSKQTKLYDSIHQISKLYVENMNQIQQLIATIDGVTCKLDEKIEGLLRKQELEFMRAYRSHLNNLNEVLRQKEGEIDAKHKELKFFQNEGAFSELIIKVKKLEEENSTIYQKSKLRDKMTADLKLEVKILRMQNKRLLDQIKRQLRQKRSAAVQSMLKDSSIQNRKSQMLVLTDLIDNKRLTDMFVTQAYTRSMSEQAGFLMGLEQQRQEKNDPAGSFSKLQIQNIKLSRQMKNMNSKYSKLLKDTVDRETGRTELEDFFFNCIQEVKKEICSRRKTLSCDFKDFRHDDKVKVLLTLLTHEQIVKSIHKTIFLSSKPNPHPITQPCQPSGKSLNIFSLSDQPQLPKLKIDQLRARSLVHRRLRVKNGKLQS